MSIADRDKWDARYREGAYATRTYPGVYLEQQISSHPTLNRGRALDIACGAGRNAIYLAQQGFDVDAVDVSSVGLERAQAQASAMNITCRWICADLDSDALPDLSYDLIIMFRFVAPTLMPQMIERLAPGGMIIVEQHLQWPDPVAGPTSQRFRCPPGTLEPSLTKAGLEVLHAYEGLVTEPDGVQAALAQITARSRHPESDTTMNSINAKK